MMGKVTMNHTKAADTSTTVMNSFIDLYMGDANDAQIKVYLYLLRMMQAKLPTSVPDIADKFNETENDIMRCLKYWEVKGLMRLNFDAEGHLLDVYLEEIPSDKKDTIPSKNINKDVTIIQADKTPKAGKREKKNSNKDDEQLVFLAEQYFTKLLSPDDMIKLFYVHHELGFSLDLVDYLLQYCAGLGKKDFRYMEKVAIAWHNAGVTTVDEAKLQCGKYDKKILNVMNKLGYTNSPAPAEVDFISKWFDEYGFAPSIIEEACNRTVLQTQKNRLQYAEKILKSWHDCGVKNISDIQKLDNEHKNSAVSKVKISSRRNETQKNSYMQFTQNTYDFEQLEKELLKN